MKKKKLLEYLSNNTQQSREWYKVQRIKVEKLVTDAKRRASEEFGIKMEVNSKDNQKLYFGVLKSLRGDKMTESRPIKVSKAKYLYLDEREIMKRGKEHLKTLKKNTE